MRSVVRGLPVKAAYTVTELAEASGIARRQMARILESAYVVFVRAGRTRLVSVAELERKLPSLWEGIVLSHSWSGAGPPGHPRSTSMDLDELG
jgi:hypothetical protein